MQACVHTKMSGLGGGGGVLGKQYQGRMVLGWLVCRHSDKCRCEEGASLAGRGGPTGRN